MVLLFSPFCHEKVFANDVHLFGGDIMFAAKDFIKVVLDGKRAAPSINLVSSYFIHDKCSRSKDSRVYETVML